MKKQESLNSRLMSALARDDHGGDESGGDESGGDESGGDEFTADESATNDRASSASLLPLLPVGRGAAVNPAGRFEAVELHVDDEHLEFDDELQQQLQRPRTRYYEDLSRCVISENDSPDIPFRYSLNPYRGCLHGCSYCYARPSHEYLGLSAGLDFETRIFVKKNAASLFRDWLCRRSYQPEKVMMSGITDCYQPIERVLELTRGCLQVAAEARQPMSLLTKNALVARDADILADMANDNLVHVGLSINSLDQSLTRLMEPACSAPMARLRAIAELSQRGIPVHVMVAPVIPGLNDSEIPAVLKAAAEAGARSAGYTLLRLPQSVEEIFTHWLQTRVGHLAERVLSRLKSTRDGRLTDSRFGRRMRGSGPMADQIRDLFHVARRKWKLDERLPQLATEHFRPPRSKSGQMHLF